MGYTFFVKSSFSETKTPAQYNGFDLTYGVNAFSTLEEALSHYSALDTGDRDDKEKVQDMIVLLDKKYTLKESNFNESPVAIRPFYADYPDAFTYNPTSRLDIISSTISFYSSPNSIEYFKTLNITDSTLNGPLYFYGGKESEDYSKPAYSSWAYKPSGSVTIKNSMLLNTAFDDYATANITGSTLYSIEYTNSSYWYDSSNYRSNKVEKTKSGTSEYFRNVITGGKATVKSSELTSGIYGYKNLTVKDSTIGTINLYSTYDRTGTIEYSMVGEKVREYTTVIQKSTVSGSVSANEITVEEHLLGYKSVNLTNSTVKGTSGYIMGKEWAEYYRTEDEKIYDYGFSGPSVQKKLEYRIRATGSFKAVLNKNAAPESQYSLGAIYGYKSITIKGFTDSKKNLEFRYQTRLISGGDLYYDSANGVLTKNHFTSVGTLTASNVDIEGASNFKNLSLTNVNSSETLLGGIRNNNANVWDYTSSGKVTIRITDGKDYSVRNIGYYEKADLSGYSKKGNSAKLTVNGRIYAGTYFDENNFSVSGSLKAKNNVYITDKIWRYKSVTLENNVSCQGIDGASKSNGQFSLGGGTLTLKNNVYVARGVWGFNTVNMIASHVNDSVHSYDMEDATLNMSSSSLRANIDRFTKVNIKQGYNFANSYTGSSKNDIFTINKNSTLSLTSGMDFGGGEKDKLTVNGTLVLKDATISNLEVLSGSGTIACVANQYADLVAALPEKHKVEILNLGNSITNFVSKKYEASDDTEKKAVLWADTTENFTGWLAGSSNKFADTVDFIKLNAAGGEHLNFWEESYSGQFQIYLNGNEVQNHSDFTLAAGTNIIKITNEEGASAGYTLAFK